MKDIIFAAIIPLTQQNRSDTETAHCERRASVEITPAMIDAGVGVLIDYEPGWAKPSETVEKIFIAMTRAAAAFR